MLGSVLQSRVVTEEEEEEEEVVVEAEGRLSWHRLRHKVDFKVLYFMLVDLVEYSLIRVLHTRLFLVGIV